MDNQKFDLKDFLPREILSGTKGNKYPLIVKEDGTELTLSYFSNSSSGKFAIKREYCDFLNRYVNKNSETFHVLGLLQAEMGKTHNGCLVFANSDFRIINRVMRWFKTEMGVGFSRWKWYVKVNLPEKIDFEYSKRLRRKVFNHWFNKTKIHKSSGYPKIITFISKSPHQKLKLGDYGTLVIEIKANLFSQVIKNFVKEITNNILLEDRAFIINYMKGIIGGEGCIFWRKKSSHRAVRITSCDPKERIIFHECLKTLGVENKLFADNVISVSRFENLIKLLQMKVVCAQDKKYNKFLSMMQEFSKCKDYGYFTGEKTPHNKIPQQVIGKILELHHKNPKAPAWKIAEQVGVSAIKVQRVRREHGLGVQKPKTTKEESLKIIDYYKRNPYLTQAKLAEKTGFAEHRVRRVLAKYGPSL